MRREIDYFFPDERLNDRAEFCFSQLLTHPAESFADIFAPEKGELEGFYRLLHNSRVTLEGLEEAAWKDTAKHLGSTKEAIVIHDTTLVKPKRKVHAIEEFEERHGFFAHVSLLAEAADGSNLAYGVGALSVFTDERRTKSWHPKERWLAQALAAEERFNGTHLVHLMDREGDICSVWSELEALGVSFVIRLKSNRRITTKEKAKTPIWEELRRLPAQFEREAVLSRRKAKVTPNSNRPHPPRDKRATRLSIAAKAIDLHLTDPAWNHPTDETVQLNIVHVWEENPPSGADAVEWWLLTNESIATESDVLRVVDLYRKRWLIEEFFKGLKSGCQIEKRQFTEAESWYRLLGLYLPIVTRILNLRTSTSGNHKYPQWILSPLQWQILRLKGREFGRKVETYEQAKNEIAALGGHVKYNGPPGWRKLLKGYLDLLMLEQGWLLAKM